MRKEASTNFQNEQQLHELCDAAFTLSVISGRWKLTLLVQLSEGDKRYGELKQGVPGITERMLALQLKKLEKNGMIARRQDAGPHTLYGLSPAGRSLLPVLEALSAWGRQHKPGYLVPTR